MASALYKNPTEVEMNRYITVDSPQQRPNQVLLAGELLKAMDTVACLSAEKHAKMPCVTLTMDDLEVNESILSHGQVLNIKAKLTRSFSSSMEVLVEVAMENLLQAKKINICQAFFTFVATPKSGKANLDQLDPITMEERLQYSLAAERRKMRFAARNHAAKQVQLGVIPENPSAQSQTSDPDSPNVSISGQFTIAQTCVESIELVLPSHANHHQTTFGGQIMAWLVSVCTISASRLCHSVPSIVTVNGIQFCGPSSVGDRLVFKAMVNKTFDDNCMEVGCRVEALSVDGKSRHINSAYLIFVNPDEHGHRKPLPKVAPMTTEELRHHVNAANRRQLQMEKKKILESVGPALSVPWSEENNSILALNNVTAFRKLCQLDNWEVVSREGETSLYKCTEDQLQCIKVEATFPISADKLFNCLNDMERSSWDPIFTEAKTVKEIANTGDKIVHFVMASADKSAQPDDVLVLQSSRAASYENDDYVIAYRSIICESLPANAKYSRKENLSSGFLVQESKKDHGKSSLIYVNQVTAQVSSYMFSDLTGKTKMYLKRIERLQEFVLKTLKY